MVPPAGSPILEMPSCCLGNFGLAESGLVRSYSLICGAPAGIMVLEMLFGIILRPFVKSYTEQNRGARSLKVQTKMTDYLDGQN